MPRHRTGDEAVYRGRGHEYERLTVADFLEQKAAWFLSHAVLITPETRARLLDAENMVNRFVGSTADTVSYAWQTVSEALGGTHLCAWETVTIMCLNRAYDFVRNDPGLMPQRGGYTVCVIDEGPDSVDVMAKGFSRLISEDELVEGSTHYRNFLGELVKVGRREPCSLNAQALIADDIEMEPVIHMALSYRHASRFYVAGTIDEATARQIAESVRAYLSLTRRKVMRLWIDQISSRNLRGSETEWGAIGLLPYSSIRVMVITKPDESYVKRPWLFYEVLAGMMGQGLFVSHLTPELDAIVHTEELNDEAKEVFQTKGVVVGAGYRSNKALNRAMSRIVTDHSVDISGYDYADDFAEYCNWAIRRIAWHDKCTIGWKTTKHPVDNVTLVEFIRNLCSPQFGQAYLGLKDPLTRDSPFGPRKREGILCIEEVVNGIPSLLSNGTNLDDHFKVEEAFWGAHGHASQSRFFRISYLDENVLCLEVRDGLIRLSGLSVQRQCQFQLTHGSRMMQSFEGRIKRNLGWSSQDSDDGVSTRKLRVMHDLSRRVNKMHIGEGMLRYEDLSHASAADRIAVVKECTRRFQEFVDNERGSAITVDTICAIRSFLLNDPEMTDEEITEEVNHIGRTVSFENLKDKLELVCWEKAKRSNAKEVLEVASDFWGNRLMIKTTKLPHETVRNRVFQISERAIGFVPFIFVRLDSCMGEDDVTALGAVYGARGSGTVQQRSGNLYSRVPGYGNGKPSARLPAEIITAGHNVGRRRHSFSVTGTEKCQHITTSHVRSWPVCRFPKVEHNTVVRSTLAMFNDESACSCEGMHTFI